MLGILATAVKIAATTGGAPNADTLYTTVWIDVSKEPWILSLPEMKGRYYLFPMLDGWTNVFEGVIMMAVAWGLGLQG